ncbi:hypothetical protein [Quadrisphaera granulorum]
MSCSPGSRHYPFRDLSGSSLSLARIKIDPRESARVNLLLPELKADAMFAGIMTAIRAGYYLAGALGVPLRLMTLGGPWFKDDTTMLKNMVSQKMRPIEVELEICTWSQTRKAMCSPMDFWIATHWTTAHAIQISCNLGVMDGQRVLYLIQDYEPVFHPASTDSELARATYHAGFTMMVNSVDLAEHLSKSESLPLDSLQVFSPSVGRLGTLTSEIRRERKHRVLFYGRPSKPRNMFSVGISALRYCAYLSDQAGLQVTYASIGEAHQRIRLSKSAFLDSLGQLDWNDYFDLLASSEVLLSLQASPHPSHPPLDMVSTGGIAITNELSAVRSGRHPRLIAKQSDPIELGTAIYEIVSGSSITNLGDEFSLSLLGERNLEDVITKICADFG